MYRWYDKPASIPIITFVIIRAINTGAVICMAITNILINVVKINIKASLLKVKSPTGIKSNAAWGLSCRLSNRF